MQTKIKAVVRKEYGLDRVYCESISQEKTIQKLTGKRTLSERIIQGLRELGIEVDIYNPYERTE